MNMQLVLAVAGSVVLAAPLGAQAGRRSVEIDEFLALDRVSSPQVSPDGDCVVYALTTADLRANTRTSDLWLVSAAAGAPRRISDDARAGRSPRWSPDGGTIAFITVRGGPAQLRSYDVRRGGHAPDATP